MDRTSFDYGMVASGPYDGLYVLPLAKCMMDSSWDFPSFIDALELGEAWDDEAPMHPTLSDARKLADLIDLPNSVEREEFVSEFPLSWDT